MGITGTIAAVGAGASVASLGMKAGSDVASGFAKKQELEVKAQNAILESTAKATNYRYQGEQSQTQFDIEAGKDTMLASHAETAAEFGELQAGMTDAAARRNLATTLGNITTMRAAGGADFTSPTTAALEGNVTGVSDLNRTAAVASIKGQTAQERASADYLKQASDFALLQGAKAREMGEFNAKSAEVYGAYNADAAHRLGDTAVNLGFLNATTDILGGLGKMFGARAGSGGGAGDSGGSAAP